MLVIYVYAHVCEQVARLLTASKAARSTVHLSSITEALSPQPPSPQDPGHPNDTQETTPQSKEFNDPDKIFPLLTTAEAFKPRHRLQRSPSRGGAGAQPQTRAVDQEAQGRGEEACGSSELLVAAKSSDELKQALEQKGLLREAVPSVETHEERESERGDEEEFLPFQTNQHEQPGRLVPVALGTYLYFYFLLYPLSPAFPRYICIYMHVALCI